MENTKLPLGRTWMTTNEGADWQDVGYTVTPELYGAIGDGEADDTEAVQAALDSDYPVCFKNTSIYKISDTITLTKNKSINGYWSHIVYTGEGTAFKISSNGGSHRRDAGDIKNLYISAPAADIVVYLDYPIKTNINGLKIYDFSNRGIVFPEDGGCYECVFDNIYLWGRKGQQTIGISGKFNDCVFGHLFGVNVQTYIDTSKSAAYRVEYLHPWCAYGVSLIGEESLSEEEYFEWYNKTSCIKATNINYNNIRTNFGHFEYVYSDTYRYALYFINKPQAININSLYILKPAPREDGQTEESDLLYIDEEGKDYEQKYLVAGISINNLIAPDNIINKLYTEFDFYPTIYKIFGESIKKVAKIELAENYECEIYTDGTTSMYECEIGEAINFRSSYIDQSVVYISSSADSGLIEKTYRASKGPENNVIFELPDPKTINNNWEKYHALIEMRRSSDNPKITNTKIKYKLTTTLY